MNCASCDEELVVELWRHRCPRCKSTFVANAELISNVAERVRTSFELPPLGALGTRRCPQCTATMHRADLLGVEVDRCASHGVWFDTTEITQVVETSGGWGTERQGFWRFVLTAWFGGGYAMHARRGDPPDDL